MKFVDASKSQSLTDASLAYLFISKQTQSLDTRGKIALNPSAVDEGYFPSDEITTAWGGEVEWVHDHETYWKTLVTLAKERREANVARWEKLGGEVGISEWDYKGGYSSPAVATPEPLSSQPPIIEVEVL
jgi:hypothetical protein